MRAGLLSVLHTFDPEHAGPLCFLTLDYRNISLAFSSSLSLIKCLFFSPLVPFLFILPQLLHRVFFVFFLEKSCAIADFSLSHRVSVSRAIKPFAEPGRPPDWFSQKVRETHIYKSPFPEYAGSVNLRLSESEKLY